MFQGTKVAVSKKKNHSKYKWEKIYKEIAIHTYYASTLFEGPSISHFSCSEQRTKRFCCSLRRIFEFHQLVAV